MKEQSLRRHLSLLRLLHQSRFGLTVRALQEELGIGRASFYRYRDRLRDAGFTLRSEVHNGEARYRLYDKSVPSLPPTPRQSQAIKLARRLLAPLEGTKLIGDLDALLPRRDRSRGRGLAVEVPAAPATGEPNTAAVVERAMLEGRRLAFTYAPAEGEVAERKVDPRALYVRDGLYLDAFDVDKGQGRTFKLARMTDARVLDEPAQTHPQQVERREFGHTAKIWDGPLVEVVVRISPRAARFVAEWPLVPSQELEEQPDGAVLVRARVSGTVEAMRWVLRWGKDARVVEPPELRTAVVTELLQAIASYTGGVV